MQLVSEPTRGGGASLDLLFTNRAGLVGDVVVGGQLGLSNHEMREFLVHAKSGVSKTTTMYFGGQTLTSSGCWLRGSLGREC